MPWKKTLFSNLEEAKGVAEAMNLQPSGYTTRDDGIRYFKTQGGVTVAQKGDGPVLELPAPKFVPQWVSYERYYSGLWIEESNIKNLKEVLSQVEKKYQVGEYIFDWVLHISVRGKEDILYRHDPSGKVYSRKS